MEEIRKIINKASLEECSALAKILGAEITVFEDHKRAFEVIEDSFQWNAQSFGRFWISLLSDNQPSYRQIVEQVAEKLDIGQPALTIRNLEIQISQKVLWTVWEKMTPEQRVAMEAELRQTARQFGKGGSLAASTSIFATLTAAKLSGFGVYLLASTSLSTLTGAIGFTLPFAVYTTMSSAIATILGPVGWIGAGLFAIWKLTGANYKRLIPAIIYVSVLRAQQKQKRRAQQKRIIKIIGVILLVILVVYYFVIGLTPGSLVSPVF